MTLAVLVPELLFVRSRLMMSTLSLRGSEEVNGEGGLSLRGSEGVNGEGGLSLWGSELVNREVTLRCLLKMGSYWDCDTAFISCSPHQLAQSVLMLPPSWA